MTLILVLIVLTVVTFVVGLMSLSEPSVERKRLVRLADGSSTPIPKFDDDETILSKEPDAWWVKTLIAIGGKRGGSEEDQKKPVRADLIHAGYRRESAAALFQGARIVLAIGIPALLLVTPLSWSLPENKFIVLLLAAAGVGYVLPGWWVSRKAKARQHAMVIGLPDALDLMVVCVEAGLGVNAALARIAQEFSRSNPTTSAEFEMVNLETRAGKSTTDALRGLAERTGVSEIGSLVSMLIQTERFGTSLADTLRVHADAMRTQRLQRAEELAGKAPLKMMFPMVLIFIATMMISIGPGMLELSDFFSR